MKKILFSYFLALVLFVGLLPTCAFATMPEGVPKSLEAPTILKIELKHDEDGAPYFETQVKIPQSILRLDSEKPAGGSVFWDYSLKLDDGQWGDFGGGGYLDVVTETEGAKVAGSHDIFIIKFYPIEEGGLGEIDIKNHVYFYRIHFYYDYYEGWPDIEAIYSRASNEVSIGSGSFYSEASKWAEPELQKASSLGLIPDILKGADMTKPITREEFCELSVLMVEKATNKTAELAASNPFVDTANPEILKAYQLGITKGTSTTAFSPKVLINREQCAAMLFRAIKVIKPDGDYSIAGVKDFPDQKHISSWAVEASKYMSKIGIIKGDSVGNFMPKATTKAQEAINYGMATREAAILMTVRSFEKVPSIQTGDNTSKQPISSNTGEKGSTWANVAPKNLKMPDGLQDFPIASDASSISSEGTKQFYFSYKSKQSLDSLFNMYAEYLKDSPEFIQGKQDDGKAYHVMGNKNGHQIKISIYLSLGSQVAIEIGAEQSNTSSSTSSTNGAVPGAAPKELKTKFPSSFYDFPFAPDASIGAALNTDSIGVSYWSNNSTKSLYNMYTAYMKGSEDYWEYDQDGDYGVNGKKHGYNIGIAINESNSSLYSSEVSISIKKIE